jgi:hypothetical protein
MHRIREMDFAHVGGCSHEHTYVSEYRVCMYVCVSGQRWSTEELVSERNTAIIQTDKGECL